VKAIVVREYGDPSVLQLEDVPMPEPGPGTLRIRVRAAGLNYIDTYKRSGQYQTALPLIPGEEAVGTVDALGDGVTDFAVGDHAVFAFVQGAYAEYVIVPAAKAIHVPDGVDDLLAVAGLLQGMTAHYLSHSTFPLQPGHTAIVHAAAGGTGSLLVQMAKRRGARVIATVGTAEKAEYVRGLGADEVIIYTEEPFADGVRRILGSERAAVIYDSVGKDTFAAGLTLLKPRGCMVLYGQSSGAVPPLDPQILNASGSLFLTRPSLGHYTQTRAELVERASAVLEGIRAGWLRVRVDRTFPLEDAPAAHVALTSRTTMGKVVLVL